MVITRHVGITVTLALISSISIVACGIKEPIDGAADAGTSSDNVTTTPPSSLADGGAAAANPNASTNPISTTDASITPPTGADAGAQDPTAPTPKACVDKTSKANDKGIGAFCDDATPCEIGSTCTSDFGAPDGVSFCTKFCILDDDCGAGAHCADDNFNRGCALNACESE